MTIAINNNHCRFVDNPVHQVVFGHLNTVAFDTRNIATSTALAQASSHAWQLDPINFIPNNKLNIRLGRSTSATLVTACQPFDCNFALNESQFKTPRDIMPQSPSQIKLRSTICISILHAITGTSSNQRDHPFTKHLLQQIRLCAQELSALHICTRVYVRSHIALTERNVTTQVPLRAKLYPSFQKHLFKRSPVFGLSSRQLHHD